MERPRKSRGKKHGYGIERRADGTLLYDGQWDSNEKNGKNIKEIIPHTYGYITFVGNKLRGNF